MIEWSLAETVIYVFVALVWGVYMGALVAIRQFRKRTGLSKNELGVYIGTRTPVSGMTVIKGLRRK